LGVSAFAAEVCPAPAAVVAAALLATTLFRKVLRSGLFLWLTFNASRLG
jgi:hypothetical protein